MELGTNCRYQYCQQKDFLPFSCSLCTKSYCLDHRTPTTHECERQNVQSKAIVCPICNKTIKYNTDSKLSENEIWEIHSATECDETQYVSQELKKIYCLANNCRTELKQINIHDCKKCNKQVCLRHRMPEDHDCGIKSKLKPQAAQPQQNQGYNFNNPYNQQMLKNPWA